MLNYIKSAFVSIWANKVRSVLTVLGVVIGVTSVTILISLGQGLKNDVSSLIEGLGTNVIAVIGGKIDTNMRNSSQINPSQFVSTDIFSQNDLQAIEQVNNVRTVAPLTLVNTTIKYEDKTVNPMIVGTTPNFLDAYQILKMGQGQVFTQNDEKSIILSDNLHQEFFGDQNGLGQTLMLSQESFKVVGVLAKPATVSVFGSEIDNMVFIPFESAKLFDKNHEAKIFRIVVKAKDGADVKKVKEDIKQAILKNHHNEENFSVLTQDDILNVFDQFLSLATTLVSAIAAISLIVGGIGIMNIMLVTVTERTREIGLRKAVGATKLAILVQFLIEAVVITLLGSAIGLGITFLASAIIASKTPLKPEISFNVIGIALGISLIIGVIFGLWPALRAARKDPINALRYE